VMTENVDFGCLSCACDFVVNPFICVVASACTGYSSGWPPPTNERFVESHMTYMFVATVVYLTPGQARGGQADPRAYSHRASPSTLDFLRLNP